MFQIDYRIFIPVVWLRNFRCWLGVYVRSIIQWMTKKKKKKLPYMASYVMFRKNWIPRMRRSSHVFAWSTTIKLVGPSKKHLTVLSILCVWYIYSLFSPAFSTLAIHHHLEFTLDLGPQLWQGRERNLVMGKKQCQCISVVLCNSFNCSLCSFWLCCDPITNWLVI